LACSLEDILFLPAIWLIGVARECVQVANEVLEVIIVHIRFEAKPVLQRDRVGCDQVEAVDLGEEVLFAELGIFGVSLVYVNPDETCEVLRCERQLRPVFATVVVALICGGATEAEGKTNDETEDGEKELIDAN
jgi:hypothetical protein